MINVITNTANSGGTRIVTFGTNIASSGTLSIPANQFAGVLAKYNGNKLIITSREISA
jgi:hypothetical protein